MTMQGREIELRCQPEARMFVPDGYELVEHPNRHELHAWLSAAVRRGEVERTGAYRVNKGGAAAVVVKRLRQPRSPVPWYVAICTTAMGALVGAGIMLWHSRYIWLTLAGVALLTAGAVRLLGSHSGACECLIHRH